MFPEALFQLHKISIHLQLRKIAFTRSIHPHWSSLNAAITFFDGQLALVASLISARAWECLANALCAAHVISSAGGKPARLAACGSWLLRVVHLVINFKGWPSFSAWSLSRGPDFAREGFFEHWNLHSFLACWSIKRIWHLIKHYKTGQRFFLYVSW